MVVKMERSWVQYDLRCPREGAFKKGVVEKMLFSCTTQYDEHRADIVPQNFAMISEFMTPQGRIMHNRMTGLRPVNQRKMAKAIRRAIGMGIHPSTHRHPEIIFGRDARGPRYQNMAQERAEPANKIKVK